MASSSSDIVDNPKSFKKTFNNQFNRSDRIYFIDFNNKTALTKFGKPWNTLEYSSYNPLTKGTNSWFKTPIAMIKDIKTSQSDNPLDDHYVISIDMNPDRYKHLPIYDLIDINQIKSFFDNLTMIFPCFEPYLKLFNGPLIEIFRKSLCNMLNYERYLMNIYFFKWYNIESNETKYPAHYETLRSLNTREERENFIKSHPSVWTENKLFGTTDTSHVKKLNIGDFISVFFKIRFNYYRTETEKQCFFTFEMNPCSHFITLYNDKKDKKDKNDDDSDVIIKLKNIGESVENVLKDISKKRQRIA